MELKDIFTIFASGFAAFIGAWSKFGIEILKRRMVRKNIARQFTIAPLCEKRVVAEVLKGQIDFDSELIAIESLKARGIITCVCLNIGSLSRYSISPAFLEVITQRKNCRRSKRACNKAVNRVKKFFVRKFFN